MMDKLAHDAYSQGAFDTLQSMDIPQHIKVAAAQELTKVALKGAAKGLGNLILGANRSKGLTNQGVRVQNVLAGQAEALTQAQSKELLARQARAALGLGVTGTGLTAGGMALMGEDEPVVVPAPAPVPAPEPPKELSMMDQLGEYGSQLGDYGSDFLARAQAGDLSNTELAALASAGVLGAGGIAYGLS